MGYETRILLPQGLSDLLSLRVGSRVLLSGVVYTARDQAHRRLVEAMKSGEKPPLPIRGQLIYYTGPTPPPPGRNAGSLGPTTSLRMDPFTPFLLERGLAGAIGKGPRSSEVRKAFLDQQAIYLVAVGGAAAYLGSRVREVELVAYEDLGAEAIYRLVLEDFPVLVAYDLKGGDLFERGVGVK